MVFAFPGGVGHASRPISSAGRSQFKDKDGNPPKIESKKVKGKNVEVTRAETSGHYHPAQFPGRPGARSARRPAAGRDRGRPTRSRYFIKMVGPDKTMTKIRPDFDELLTTIKVEGK